MKTITTLFGYCKEINIPSPKYSSFDIRKFEETMKTVNPLQLAFRHEFYAVAIRKKGTNQEVGGSKLHANLFFNSPFQIITWDIEVDWQGWYIIFGREFINSNPAWQNFIDDFPFFRLDKVVPMQISKVDEQRVDGLFQQIFNEYHSDNNDKFLFIQTYTQLLLLITKRYFDRRQVGSSDNGKRSPDILLLSRFQSMVEIMVNNETRSAEVRQVSFYARQLNVHPNHLNAVIKGITGSTATAIIHKQVIASAKALLLQTLLSAKEISFKLHYPAPTHFHAAFKKAVGVTPLQFRTKANL